MKKRTGSNPAPLDERIGDYALVEIADDEN
jgi:hypothetical protein